MKYHIVVEKWAAKFIRKQQPAQQKRIMQALAQLPFAGDIKPMAVQKDSTDCVSVTTAFCIPWKKKSSQSV